MRVDTHVSGSDQMVGRLLADRYRVGPRIARGGMATVYRTTDTRLDRTVALKVMHPGYAEDPEFVRRFQREARSAAALSHPNVVAVFDQGFDPDTGAVFLTMEYVPGHTLRDLLDRSGPLPVGDALALLEPVLSALAAAHAAGLVHRDVKPENILLCDAVGTTVPALSALPGLPALPARRARRAGTVPAVKVADFGLARAVSGGSTATQGLLIGTVSYLAPEQLTSGRTDARSDVYAAGVVLYEMLVGDKPHTADAPIHVAYKHVNEDIPIPSERMPGLPGFVDALVVRATVRDPDARPADAAVLLHQLRRARSAVAQGVDDRTLTEDLLGFRRAGSTDPTEPIEPPEPGHAVHAADHARVETPRPNSAPTERVRVPRRTGSTVAHTTVVPLDGTNDGAGRAGPHSDGADRAIRRRRRILAVLVGAALLAAAGVYWFQIARYTEVPLVLDKTAAELAELATSSGLDFEVAGRVWHDSVPADRVARSSPEPGTRVRNGSSVEVWLSRGVEEHPMPELVGRSEDEARDALGELKLRIGDLERVHHDTVPEGEVLTAEPEPGTMLPKGTGVQLTVSNGPAPVDIPDVSGRPAGEARSTLEDLGLVVSATERFSDDAPAGEVIGQQPGEGTGRRGDQIELTVSKGPEFIAVPRVTGMGVEQAEQALRDLGFEVEIDENAFYVGAGIVVSQSPGSGDEARAGSIITLGVV